MITLGQNFSISQVLGLVILTMVYTVNPVIADTEVWSFRGGLGEGPENTIEGINLALDLGASGTEIDLWYAGSALGPTVTPEIVILHDRSVERTTNGFGEVQNLSYEYLRTLDASNGDVRFPGAKIPTLDEVLNVLQPRDKAVLLDIKISSFGQLGSVPPSEIASALARANFQSDNIYTWTNSRSLVKEYANSIPDLKIIYNGRIDVNTVVWQDFIDQGYTDILIRYDTHPLGGGQFNQAFIDEIHANGLSVVLNGGSGAQFQQAVEFGVDIVMTHNVDGFTRLLAEMTPLLGDCNQDEKVDFLDISPFISTLTTGDYLNEADIDRNETIDFLDIAPFINLLSGD